MSSVTVIDLGLGNILSVTRALEKIGIKVILATTESDVISSTPIIIPGVGTFPKAMERLEKNNLKSFIKNSAKKGNPILGICLGMQILCSFGTEHRRCAGLDLIQGDVELMVESTPSGERLTLPSVGWRKVNFFRGLNQSIEEFPKIDQSSFYFVHSYHAVLKTDANLVATYQRDETSVAAFIAKENIWGVQFHPEKSGELGLNFLKEFLSR